MSPQKGKLKIGIIGCGAIGSGIARSVKTSLKNDYALAALYDVETTKTRQLAKSISSARCIKESLQKTICACDILVDATSADDVAGIVRKCLLAKKSILTVNVGQMLNAQKLFALAKRQSCRILLPSGAVAGIDAVKAASLVGFKKVYLTTRKPLKGLTGNPYLIKKGIDVTKIKKETVLFKGGVDAAVKAFPRNINVAATLALACGDKKKLHIEIRTSPKFRVNSHEIETTGEFGRMRTCTENVACPDNPKSSYLAVLSGIQTLKQVGSGIDIGT